MAPCARDGGPALRIAMVGQKGFPAVWGGVEFHVDEVARGLAARGHDVTVFVRPSYQREVKAQGLSTPENVRVRVVPSIPTKHLDALTHTFFSTFCVGRAFDIVHYHAVGPGSLIALARRIAPRAVTVLTVHALDWQREKWSSWAKRLIRRGEALGVRRAHGVIAVSADLRAYLADEHGVDAVVIRNGVRATRRRPAGRGLAALGLESRRYFLFMGRLVPEKGAHHLVEAYRRLSTDWRVVLAGPAVESPYCRKLAAAVRRDRRVLLAGVAHGELRDELYSNAGAFILPSSVEGMPLALLEALSYGLPVVASDLTSVREVAARVGPGRVLMFAAGNVADLAARLGAAQEAEVLVPGTVPLPGASWEEVASRTEAFYRELLVNRKV